MDFPAFSINEDFCKSLKSPDKCTSWLHLFWGKTMVNVSELTVALQAISKSDIDDDYNTFLEGDNLFNAGKQILQKRQPKESSDLEVNTFNEILFLLNSSRVFLRQWSRKFCNIVSEHPEPMLAIKGILEQTLRGEIYVLDSFKSTHRSFTEAERLFLDFVEDRRDSETEKSLIRRQRIERALRDLLERNGQNDN